MSIEYVNPSGLKHHGEKVLSEAKTYTDEKIDAIVGEGASETLDTIGEISKAIEDNEDVVEALNSAIGNKVDKVDGKGLSANDLTDTLKSNYDTAYSHSQSSHAPSTAEKNVIVGIQRNGTDLSVDSSTRKVNVTVPTKTSELTNDSGFKTTDNNTTYELSKSGSTITLTGSDGSTTSVSDSNTTYSVATSSANGLMSSTDKSKLNGIATGANAYTLPTASSSTLGGVKTTSTVTSTSGLTASPIIDGVPYYDKRTSVSSPLPNSTTFGTYYPVLCPSVATNVSSLSVDTGIKFGSRSGSLTLDGSNTTTSDSSFVSLTVKMPKSGQYSSTGISITPAGTSAYHTGMSINCGTSTGPGMRGLIISCTANTHQPTLEIDRTGGTNSYAISCQKGKSYIADIYSNAAINTTSDREKKMDIKDITSDYEELFFKLQPRLFKYKDGNSGRIHIGAIAQEVEEALDAVGIDDSNFAGFVRQEKDYKVNEETGEVTQEEGYDYYLRYEEFIMLLCHMLQKLYSEKEEQDNKISDLEERLASLESKLA